MRIFERFLLPLGGALILLGVCVFVFFFVLPQETAPTPVIPVDDDSGEPDWEEPKNILVAQPVAGDTVGFPLEIVGQARVFENVFHYRVRDSAGVILAEGYAMANAPDMGLFGNFSLSVQYDEPTVPTGIVEVFSYSARDGSEENMVSLPVTFSSEVATQEISVYFLPQQAGEDCGAVLPASRRISATPAVAHAALTELLLGVRSSERDTFLSLIPPYAHVRSLLLDDGILTVTFAEGSFSGVAGSCMVQGIRAQITATLLQFPSVSSVIIREEGKTAEETLQP